MLKTAAGEWILSLVTTRERASAMMGDCLEDTRGTLALWWFVLRTMVSLCGREIWESRWRLLGLGLCGVALETLLIVGFIICAVLLAAMWISLLYAFRGADMATPAVPDWVFAAAARPLIVVVPFLAGRALGQLSRGREIAAGFVFCVLREVAALAVGLAVALHLREASAITWFAFGFDPLFVMAGALSWRARHPRAA